MQISDYIDAKEILSHITDIAPVAAVFLFTSFSSSIKAWLEKKTNDKFERSINKNSTIRDVLAEVRALYDADRVLLFQLHNGQYYFSGEGADKLSLTHFTVHAGVAVPDRAGTRLQNIPVTYFPEAFKMMSEQGCFFAQATEFEDPFAAQMFSVDGVQAAICGPIRDRKKLWRGVLFVCFLNDKEELDLEVASTHAQRIADLLTI